ncbi:MAG: tRNA 2-thiocytidine biosynthesis protein TtcA [Clostridia bacterium]|nr:tRNA 2-thiocytidine biosynthesis protein TtcA [Clostridia bacterium]
MSRELTACQLVERSISKKYRKEIWNPFIAAVKRYELVEAGDKIAVCVSGGKDSFLCAVLMRMLQRFSEVPFEVVFLCMDPGYQPENRRRIEENAALLNLPLHIFETDIFDAADKTDHSPCYLCARMRRGHLYSEARKLGCNKIALGHHFSDVIETTVMAMFYGGQLQAMLPKLHSTNYPGMTLIRPLYCVNEKDILAWVRYNGLSFIQCACRVTEREAGEEHTGKRREIKQLIAELKKTNPQVEENIFASLHSVWLDTFPGYLHDRQAHSFLEKYDESAECGVQSSDDIV